MVGDHTGCEKGLSEYHDDFIHPLAVLLSQHSSVPVVAILEPDSLPNLVTNADTPECGSKDTQTAYRQGLRIAVTAIKRLAPGTTLYLDAGHGGWMGWDTNAKGFIQLVCDLGLSKDIRGFASNVANYNPLGTPCPSAAFDGEETASHYCNWIDKHSPCCTNAGPCGSQLLESYNSGISELVFVQTLAKYAHALCATLEPHFVIDTSRNGNVDARQVGGCDYWCNLRSAGLGPTPTAATGLGIVDAFFWIKTPGESDGCSTLLSDGSACPRYDSHCGLDSSLTPAPEAGQFSSSLMDSLVRNGVVHAVPRGGSGGGGRSEDSRGGGGENGEGKLAGASAVAGEVLRVEAGPVCTSNGLGRFAPGNRGGCCSASCVEPRPKSDSANAKWPMVTMCREACDAPPPLVMPSPAPPPPPLPPPSPPPSPPPQHISPQPVLPPSAPVSPPPTPTPPYPLGPHKGFSERLFKELVLSDRSEAIYSKEIIREITIHLWPARLALLIPPLFALIYYVRVRCRSHEKRHEQLGCNDDTGLLVAPPMAHNELTPEVEESYEL